MTNRIARRRVITVQLETKIFVFKDGDNRDRKYSAVFGNSR